MSNNIWNHPEITSELIDLFIYLTGHGNVRFTEEEVQILRKYLTSGGFLHADDNFGMDESFRREMARASVRSRAADAVKSSTL